MNKFKKLLAFAIALSLLLADCVSDASRQVISDVLMGIGQGLSGL